MFIIKYMLKYLADLVFDHQNEYNFKSPEFKPRKFALFLLVCSLLIYNTMLTVRMFNMAIDFSESKAKVIAYVKLEKEGLICRLDEQDKNNKDTIYQLQPKKLGTKIE